MISWYYFRIPFSPSLTLPVVPAPKDMSENYTFHILRIPMLKFFLNNLYSAPFCINSYPALLHLSLCKFCLFRFKLLCLAHFAEKSISVSTVIYIIIKQRIELNFYIFTFLTLLNSNFDLC
jgi:hypothetical protein